MAAAIRSVIPALIGAVMLGATVSTESRSEEQTIRVAVDRFVEAFNNLDWDRFQATFAPDATIFNPEVAEITDLGRLDGRSAMEATFRTVFAAARQGAKGPPYLHVVPRNVRVQLLRSTAVVTFVFDHNAAGSSGRRTLVFERRGNEWKIVHLHASNVGSR